MLPSYSLPIGTTIYAPGKLVLAGEYAVLDGTPAISLAINRGVSCTIQSSPTGQLCSTPDGDSRFVLPALSTIGDPAHYAFQNWNPVQLLHDGQKPGFGGSAAACVAACYAAQLPLEQALQIHHAVQGSGSGIDVATSIHGGMIWIENGQYGSQKPILPVVIWSGASAKTGPKVERYLNWKKRDQFIEFSTIWTRIFLEEPIEATKMLYQNLCRMAQQANIPYVTSDITTIVELAERHHGAAKPSGAGGGDCVIAFFPSETSKEGFIKDCQDRYPIIPIEISKGVHHIEPKEKILG